MKKLLKFLNQNNFQTTGKKNFLILDSVRAISLKLHKFE